MNRQRGLYYRLQHRGMVDLAVTDEEIDVAVTTPPQTTRARLRGEFVQLVELAQSLRASTASNQPPNDNRIE